MNLTSYIARPGAEEKLLYSDALNFFAHTFVGQQIEMLSMIEGAARSKDPLNHYLMSWREGEIPSIAQIKEAASVLIKELGAEGLHVIYGAHQDTQNVHIHFAVSRVDPDSGKVVELNKGFDKEAGHKAIAIIEHGQGWQRENNGRYRVVEGVLQRCEPLDDMAAAKPTSTVADQEVQRGEKSAQRVGIESAAPVIASAESWVQLHEGLNQRGMRFEKKGSGAIVWVGDIPVKASTIDRAASMTSLIKRLGKFKPAVTEIQVNRLQAESLKDDQPEWTEYRKDRDAHYSMRDQDRYNLGKLIESERSSIASRQKGERAVLFLSREWKGGGDELNAARSVLAARHAAQKADQKDAHKRARGLSRLEFGAFPRYEDWLRGRGHNDQAEKYRHSKVENLITGRGTAAAAATDIRSFRGLERGRDVHYSRPGEQSASFIDRGHQISVLRSDDSSLLAALQLGAAKWGSVTISGSQEFKERAIKIAIEAGIRINNPELQQMTEDQKRRWPKT